MRLTEGFMGAGPENWRRRPSESYVDTGSEVGDDHLLNKRRVLSSLYSDVGVAVHWVNTMASKLHCIVSLQICSIESPMITMIYSVCTVTLL